MNTKEMHNAINKGIPNLIKLELPTGDLIKYCSDDSAELLNSMRDIRKEYEEAIMSISGYNKSHHEFFDNLRLITNYKDSKTQIYVSPLCFIKRLKTILDIKNESLNLEDEELLNEFNSQLELLDSINDIDELEEKFSIIYEDYKYGLVLNEKIKEEVKKNGRVSTNKIVEMHQCGLDSRAKVFLENQKEMYHSLVNNAKYIEEYANNYPINLEYFDGLDKDKFELYVANKYLEYAKSNDDKQAAIYYLTTYLNESCGKVIKMNYKDQELSNISLLKEFRLLLRSNRELKPINESRSVYESYHIKHVKNHINKYLNGLKNWCYIKITPEEIINNQRIRVDRILEYNDEHPEIESRSKEYLIKEKYMTMLIRKLNFYEHSNYVLRLFGVGPFESRVAYFYSNGMVVIDKLYEESLDIDPTYNEAIYIMDVNTFLSMSIMDKPSLREDDNVLRIIHSGFWEERLMQEIENPSINLSVDDVRTLVKKYSSNK